MKTRTIFLALSNLYVPICRRLTQCAFLPGRERFDSRNVKKGVADTGTKQHGVEAVLFRLQQEGVGLVTAESVQMLRIDDSFSTSLLIQDMCFASATFLGSRGLSD